MTRKRKGQTKLEQPANQEHENDNILNDSSTEDLKECNGFSNPLKEDMSITNSENSIQNNDQEIQAQKRTHRGKRKHNKNNNNSMMKNEEIQKDNATKTTNETNVRNNQNKSMIKKDVPNTQLPKTNQKNYPVNLLAQLLQQNLALPPLDMNEDEDEEMEDCIEYKFKPRPVFLANACNYCKSVESNEEVKLTPCPQCKMVRYCSTAHRKYDISHPQFCSMICDLRNSTGMEHIYQNAKGLSMDDFRHLRIEIMSMCQNASGRLLEPNEREILLFPRLCNYSQCREWRTEKLANCPDCQQISYCISHPDHLSKQHALWCKFFKLFHQITARIFKEGTIEPELPERIFTETYSLPNKIDDTFKDIYEDVYGLYDESEMAVLSLMATAPLSVIYAMQKIKNGKFPESLNIHVVGAELQFEGDTLNKWEAFFLHLVPEIKNLKIVFIGPELNVENLPVDELSKIGLCKSCQSAKRVINFEFQCKKLYHDYAATAQFSIPDIICAFNPGLHRITGYGGQDTWPKTITAILNSNVPFISTAYTKHEAPLDLKRIQESAGRQVEVLVMPQVNPYASLKPDRNFISEESAPFIFKNFYITVVK